MNNYMKNSGLIILIAVSLFIGACTSEVKNENTDPLFETVPVIGACNEGSVSEQEKQKVLKYINTIRSKHNLPAVEYNYTRDRMTQRAALITAANAEVSYSPTSDAHCYSEEGKKGCESSALSLWGSSLSNWVYSEYHINEWLTGLDGNIDNRRKILNPFLKTITFGRIIGTPKRGEYKYVSSASLLLNDFNTSLSDFDGEFVAYPQGSYDAKLFDAKAALSFSAVYDYSNQSNSNVDYSGAQVTVMVGSQELIVTEVSYDNRNAGLANCIQWKVEGLAKNVIYDVKISNVIVNSVSKDYEYNFSFK